MKGKLCAVFLILLAQGCSDDGPGAPSSPSPTTTAPAVPPTSWGEVLSGRVVDAVTGSPVAGASVAVDGMDPISTDSAGEFRIERTSNASVRLVVQASGYWPRETGIRPASAALLAVTLSLLPDGNDFDLEFYDHVFRHVGEAGTHPWISEPRFEVWERTYECTGFTDSGPCEELTAAEELAPAVFAETMRGVIGADASRYTDGHVLGSSLTTRSHAPGAVIPRSQYIEPGKVTAAFVNRADRFSWAFWRYQNDGAMIGAHLQINARHRGQRGVYSHWDSITLSGSKPCRSTPSCGRATETNRRGSTSFTAESSTAVRRTAGVPTSTRFGSS